MKKIKTIVLDASAILKPILEEEGKEKVNKIFQLKENYKLSILVPDIFRYEFINTLGREKDSKTAEDALKGFTATQVTIIPLDADLIHQAFKITSKYKKISFYDAAYHALAKGYGLEFITADERYYKITKKEGNIKLLANLKL